jgi:peptidyl-prolyl isomerase E (cyclophilin E)
LAEDAAAAIDNMNDAELYGRTIRVNFARPPKVTEQSSRPVWADDEWLKLYGHGAGEGVQTEETGDGDNKEEVATGEDGEVVKKAVKPKLPRVYFGVKIGIR